MNDGFKSLKDDTEWAKTRHLLDIVRQNEKLKNEERMREMSNVTTPEKTGLTVKDKDMVNSPSHYKLNAHGIECIDAIRAALTDDELRGYLKANVFKYLWRERYKHNSVEDAKKAHWYLNKLIELLEKDKKSV